MTNVSLGNPSIGAVSRIIAEQNSIVVREGNNLTTGTDKSSVVNTFLSGSLSDSETVLKGVIGSAVSTANVFRVINESQNVIAKLLQDGLNTITSSSSVSPDKLVVLQENLDAQKSQVSLAINTSIFDGRKLLNGDSKEIKVQAGVKITDQFTVGMKDISGGKLFRSSVTTELNRAIVDAGAAGNTYYASDDEIAEDVKNNGNLATYALTNDTTDGSGTGAAVITDAEFEAIFMPLMTAKPELGEFLNVAAPLSLAVIDATTPGGTFADLTAGDIVAVLGDAGAKAELLAILQDDVATNISETDTTAEAKRAIAQNVLLNGLNIIRTEQARANNQQKDIEAMAAALTNTAEVLGKTGKEYIQTNYLVSSQALAEARNQIVAGGAALSANNKVSEAILSTVRQNLS